MQKTHFVRQYCARRLCTAVCQFIYLNYTSSRRTGDQVDIRTVYGIFTFFYRGIQRPVSGPSFYVKTCSDFFIRASCIFYSLFCLCDAKFLFQRVPGCNGTADLPCKIMFWTHKFGVGLIEMGICESQDP